MEDLKQQYYEKAAELSAQLNVKVHPILFKDEEAGEDIVGYIKEPDRIVKIRVLDKSVMGSYSAAAEMLDIILIKEHSDRRIWEEKPENDRIYLGAVMAAYDTIKLNVNQLKKK